MRHFPLFCAPVALAIAALAMPAQAAITLKLSGFQVGSMIGSGAANSTSNADLSRTLAWQVSSFGAAPALVNNVVTRDAAGQFGGTIDMGDGLGSKSFTAYCVELNQSFSPFPSTAAVTYQSQSAGTYFSAGVADKIGRLYSEGITLDSADKTAAFQVALWEVIYEKSGVFGVGDNAKGGNADFISYGGGTANSKTFALAQGYLDAIGVTPNSVALTVLTNSTQQDLIVATPVPEPTTLAMMTAGLTGLGLLGSRRQRQR